MSSLRTRVSFSNVVSVLALFAVLGGGAWAASTIGGGGKVSACYRTGGKTKGLVRLVPTGTACKHGEKALAWNMTGPKGAAGATGATGANGANGEKGAKGDKGDTGAPGSTILARMQGIHEQLSGTTGDPNVTFTPGTWNQAAGEDQLVLGTLTVTALTGCNAGAGHVLLVTLKVDGLLGTPLQVVGPGTYPFLASPVAALSPVAAGSHTVTAVAGNSCTGPADFFPSVDIVSFK